MLESSPILIVSCYELGHQPIAVASVAGFLKQAGFATRELDLAVDRLEVLDRKPEIQLALLSVPMHTALHIGMRAARKLRRDHPAAHICFYGNYAALNAEFLLEQVADSIIGGEVEARLVALARALHDDRPLETVAGLRLPGRTALPVLERLAFVPPDRERLPPLESYARLEIDGERRLAAAVETSRGCLHLCRHCPIPPVYSGRFFVVPAPIVLEDIRALVQAGARHLTFADPDFFNGPGHSMAIVRAMHEAFPRLTFDVTTKIEHLLKQRRHLEELARCGCVFVVSAVESLSDEVLCHLRKGHTRAQVDEALSILRSAGIALRPSLVAFTPWTRIEDYLEVLDWVDREQLVDHLDPVQFSIRLLVPPHSALAGLPAMRPHLRELRRERFAHDWVHPDPRMDRLHGEVCAIVRRAAQVGEDVRQTFEHIRHAAVTGAGHIPAPDGGLPARRVSPPPRLTEPWFC